MWTRRGRATARAARTDVDRIADLAAENGEPVGEVLREVADFRLALETDLLIAAAAADAGAPDILADVVDGERAQLVSFQDRLLDRLAEAETTRTLNRRTRGPGRARLVGAAAALLAVVGGGVATQQATTPATANAALAEADKELTTLAAMTAFDAPADELQQAADALHETIEGLIAEHGDDPHYAAKIAQLIVRERTLLMEKNPNAREALVAVHELVLRLATKAPPQVRRTLTVPALPAPAPSPKATAKEQPKPKPSPSSQSPSPKPSSSSPKPSSSSSPSQGGGGFPNPPAPPP